MSKQRWCPDLEQNIFIFVVLISHRRVSKNSFDEVRSESLKMQIGNRNRSIELRLVAYVLDPSRVETTYLDHDEIPCVLF
jgi:hypothetical protein